MVAITGDANDSGDDDDDDCMLIITPCVSHLPYRERVTKQVAKRFLVNRALFIVQNISILF